MTVRKSTYGAGMLLLAVVLAGTRPALSAGTAAPPPEPARLPEWAVLVLQPVGDKRVRPVTGVVVAADGAVMVPADFAEPGDVLIVLDGGTDIFEHGRAATVRARDQSAGISVLDVRGLTRAPAQFAAGLMPAEAVVHLAAFPPAEQIAEGVAPLRLPSRVGELRDRAKAPTDAAIDSGPGPLPNVSGPLVDPCGRLAGYSLAHGVPGMTAVPGTSYAWSDSLAAAIERAGLAPGFTDCAMLTGNAGVTSAAGEEYETTGRAPGTDPAPEPAGREPRPADAMADSPPLERRLPPLAWIAALLGVLAAAFAAWRFRRWRAAERPGLLQDAAVSRAGVIHSDRPAPEAQAPSANGGWTLEVRGVLPGGAAFTRRCAVNPAAIDVVVGSGPADISIAAAGMGREHVRLGGRSGAMTLSDLGSPGGTWINRVPCSRGEVMFVSEGDMVVLGETSFRVDILPPGASRAGETRGQ